MATRVLVIDNYDSFVYNLVQELGELGADPVVFRNDAIDIDGIRAQSPDGILIRSRAYPTAAGASASGAHPDPIRIRSRLSYPIWSDPI